VESVAWAKGILSRKYKACRRIKPELAETFAAFAASIVRTKTLELLRLFEARASKAY
jgi:CRISPR-associated protein Cas1